MFEKVNPSHPDKVADRIAGAVVDLAYKLSENPHIAVEVLIGHGVCHAIIETDTDIRKEDVAKAIARISGITVTDIIIVEQDKNLNANQSDMVRCGDNGIFKGMPVTEEQKQLTRIAKSLYEEYPHDGKYILDGVRLIICQSNAETKKLEEVFSDQYAEINPLGDWTGGTDVDTGATNRKLGSDMGDSVTGGGLHGKDLSKADVAVNIYAFLEAQRTGKPVEISCAIGDGVIDGVLYSDIVRTAKEYIDFIGGFEKFAEWGLIR